MTGDAYICGLCGRPQEKGRSDEEAEAEYREHFPEAVEDARGIVCDDCWHYIYDPDARQFRDENFGVMPPWSVQTLEEMRARLG